MATLERWSALLEICSSSSLWDGFPAETWYTAPYWTEPNFNKHQTKNRKQASLPVMRFTYLYLISYLNSFYLINTFLHKVKEQWWKESVIKIEAIFLIFSLTYSWIRIDLLTNNMSKAVCVPANISRVNSFQSQITNKPFNVYTLHNTTLWWSKENTHAIHWSPLCLSSKDDKKQFSFQLFNWSHASNHVLDRCFPLLYYTALNALFTSALGFF